MSPVSSTKLDESRPAVGDASVFWPHLILTRAIPIAVALIACSACSGKKDVTGPVQAPIVSRASTVPSTSNGYIDARGSQIVSSGAAPGQVFDDFTFTAASSIRTVSWQGSYCVPTNGTVAPAPTASAFRVSFYADSSGRPKLSTGALVATNYPLAQVAETLDRNISGLTCNAATSAAYAFYRYQVTLTAPFAAAANTKYWFSVQAVTPSYNVYWGWRDGLVDNSLSLIYFNSVFSTNGFDRAFSLTP